jgi:DNA-binding response OmpR family regulator
MHNEGMGIADLLVVDDNPADLRFVEEAFRESALEPTIYTSSTREDDALRFLSRCDDDDHAPDPVLVLLDWNLSRSTGQAVLEAAKSGDSPTPVIVMTGGQVETSTGRAAIEGADLVIEKPTDPAGYVDAVRSVLSGS